MTRQVSLDERAIDQATAFLADDPKGLRAVLIAIDALAEHARDGCNLQPGASHASAATTRRAREATVNDDQRIT